MTSVFDMSPAELKAAALADVNEIRRTLHLEPLDELPRGNKHARTCPMARALDEQGSAVVFWASAWVERVDEFGVRCVHKPGVTDAIGLFVRSFDNGDFPELLA